MYKHEKPVSEFSEGRCDTVQWNEAIPTVVTSVKLLSSDIRDGDVWTEFEEEPTVEEIAALENLAETIIWQ
jgi:hypothetical protein